MIISSDGMVAVRGTVYDLQKDLIFAMKGLLDKGVLDKEMLEDCLEIAGMSEKEMNDEVIKMLDAIDFDVEDLDDDDDDDELFRKAFGDLL